MSKCINCEAPLIRYGINIKYCSNSCQHTYQNNLFIKRWLHGEETGCVGKTLQLSKPIKRWLKESRGSACEVCSWDGKHPIDGKSLTEIDHVDGDASNNRPENLKILCPNCHSMTTTFRARNKKSARSR